MEGRLIRQPPTLNALPLWRPQPTEAADFKYKSIAASSLNHYSTLPFFSHPFPPSPSLSSRPWLTLPPLSLLCPSLPPPLFLRPPPPRDAFFFFLDQPFPLQIHPPIRSFASFCLSFLVSTKPITV